MSVNSDAGIFFCFETRIAFYKTYVNSALIVPVAFSASAAYQRKLDRFVSSPFQSVRRCIEVHPAVSHEGIDLVQLISRYVRIKILKERAVHGSLGDNLALPVEAKSIFRCCQNCKPLVGAVTFRNGHKYFIFDIENARAPCGFLNFKIKLQRLLAVRLVHGNLHVRFLVDDDVVDKHVLSGAEVYRCINRLGVKQ